MSQVRDNITVTAIIITIFNAKFFLFALQKVFNEMFNDMFHIVHLKVVRKMGKQYFLSKKKKHKNILYLLFTLPANLYLYYANNLHAY